MAVFLFPGHALTNFDKGSMYNMVHSLRHTSTTYKLRLSGGDIKAVQGDTGHAQATMVTERYSHIMDDDRRLNTERMQSDFYEGKTSISPPSASPSVSDAALTLAKALEQSSELMNMLKTLMNKT